MDARRALREIATAVDAWQDSKGVTLSFVDSGLVHDLRQILAEVEEPVRSSGDELAAVDAAVRGLLESDGRTVDAWAVVAGMQRLEPGVRPEISPLEHSLDYATSAGISPAHGLGLVDALAAKLRRLTRGAWIDEE
jgi:hypothetical protein